MNKILNRVYDRIVTMVAMLIVGPTGAGTKVAIR